VLQHRTNSGNSAAAVATAQQQWRKLWCMLAVVCCIFGLKWISLKKICQYLCRIQRGSISALDTGVPTKQQLGVWSCISSQTALVSSSTAVWLEQISSRQDQQQIIVRWAACINLSYTNRLLE
jgi:hypothetical protein